MEELMTSKGNNSDVHNDGDAAAVFDQVSGELGAFRRENLISQKSAGRRSKLREDTYN